MKAAAVCELEDSAPPSDTLAAKVQEARRIDARIAAVVKRGRRARAELAFLLAQFERDGLYAALKYEDVGAYAEQRGHVISARLAHDLVRLVKGLERFPVLQAAFRDGEVPWTKVRTVLRIATLETQEALIKDMKKLSSRALEAKVSAKKGEAPLVRRTFAFAPEDEAMVERRVDEVRREARARGEELTPGQALARICREGGQAGARPEAAAARVVIHATEDGRKAWVETRRGQVPVAKETLEEALCDAELSDVSGGPERLTATVPPRIRRHVIDRDRGRCRVPGCMNMGYLHVHHEPGRKVVGHDPDAMLLLCTGHHRMRHRGQLTIHGRHSTGFRFTLADGTELVADSREGVPATPPGETSPVSDLALAKVALKKLGVSTGEVDALLADAREALAASGEPCSVDALVRNAVLRL